MWFTNGVHGEWIACPQVDRPSTSLKWSASGGYLNGGAFVKRSLSGARNYEMDFGLRSRDDARKITDFYDGVWGPGPFYWVDPMTTDKNVFPQNWATPSLGAYDGTPLLGNGTRPVLAPTAANTRELPPESAVYTGVNQVDAAAHKVWIPIPDGYSLRVWGWGSVTGTVVVRATRTDGVNNTIPLNAPGLVGAPIGLTVVGSPTVKGIHVLVRGIGNLTLTSLQAVYFQTGKAAPAYPGFISGQGHSGCEFTDFEQSDYSAAMDKVGITATLTEVGQWL